MIMASHFPVCIKKNLSQVFFFVLKPSEVSKKQNEHCGDKQVKETHSFKLLLEVTY
mgnify:CR=1 FL=1